ncbi:MAG: exodeoxyribonuclease VII large subunit [Anaerolineae bacterium]|nr:exodeoxyribonuclease VII large subunit [Anaerolineae bacterium]
MDISVSQLNHRLALQLPAELPLGLVFVTGTVRNLESAGEGSNGRTPFTSFDLEQKGHHLRCRLSAREAEKVTLREELEVRLGGHLTFDPRRAAYSLLARDVEVIGGLAGPQADPLALDLSGLVEDQAAFTAALAGIKRRADVSRQSPAEVPVWVQKIAPPEVAESQPVDKEEAELATAVAPSPATPLLNDELVSYLSALMESEEEVELTPDILAQWQSEPQAPALDFPEDELPLTSAPVPLEDEVAGEMVTAVSPYAPVGDAAPKPRPTRPRPPQPRGRQQVDWAVILLLIAIIIFTIVVFFVIMSLR